MKRQINPKLRIEGILLTMVDARTNNAREIAGLIRETYGSRLKVFDVEIPRSVRAAEISAEGKSIFAHDPGGKVAAAYKELTKAMPKRGANISLSSYDDIFETDESRADAQLERVQKIPISELVPFKDHPFKVVDDEAMLRTMESIAQYGVLTPLIARPLEDGTYEIISGHRRVHAAQAAGLTEVPVIVRDMDDDAATVLMVDSNLQRENILPSERAFAYKMKLEAMKRQGERTDLQEQATSTQVGRKLETAEMVGKEVGDSRNQVRRYIRLTYLIPEFLDLVDEKKISFNPAVELSYLKPTEQEMFLSVMEWSQNAPSLSQAQRLKKLSQEGKLTPDAMREIMNEVKKGDLERVTFRNETLRKYFPRSYTAQQMQDQIIKLLEQWQKRKQRDQER